jgi:hypothetical protein
VLVILKENIGVDYSSYYAYVKTEIYKLFAKYDSKFGSTRSQRPAHPAVNLGKRKQAWGRIFGGPRSSTVVGPPSLPLSPLHINLLPLLLVSSQLIWTVTISLHMRMILICFSGGVTTN